MKHRQRETQNDAAGYVFSILTARRQHALRERGDERRSMELPGRGYRVLRYWNNEILDNPDRVLETILGLCRPTHLP